MAATPTVTFLDGASISPFIGNTQTLTLRFDNTGGAGETGYAPYIDLRIPKLGADGAGAAVDDGLTLLSATHLGAAVEVTLLTFDQYGFASIGKDEPTIGGPRTLTGTPGDQVAVLRLPFGSFTDTQTPADVELTFRVSNLADLNTPLPLTARGAFAYGGDPADNALSDPAIIGAPTTLNVVPGVATLDVQYLGPEQETATGPSYPRAWESTATLATGQPFTNLTITDTIPDGVVITGTSLVNKATGLPMPGTITVVQNPDGTQTVTAVFSGTITGGPNMLPTLHTDWYVTEFLHDGTPVLDPATGSFRPLEQNSRLDASWDPLDGRDDVTQVTINQAGPEDIVTAKSIAIQKGVELTSPAAQPGGVLKYTLDGQVSNYFEMNDLVVTDTLGDGQTFRAGTVPTLKVTEAGVTTTISLAGFYSVTGKDALGKSVVTFDVSGAMAASGLVPDDILDGNGGGLNQAPHATAYQKATIQIVFETELDETWTGPVPGDIYVDQGDPVGNTVDYDGDVLSTGNRIGDDSGASVTIPVNEVGKEIVAVNGDVTRGTDDFSDPAHVQAGDTITFRLTLDLPLTSSHTLKLSDYLPLPVLTALALTYDASAALPDVGEFRFDAATDQWLARTGIVPNVAFSAAGNSITFDFGGVAGNALPVVYPQTHMDLLFTVAVNDQKFGDGLLLTNQVTSTETDSFGQTVEDNAIIRFELGEPVLRVTKGVIATDNPDGVFTGSVGPVSFTAVGSAGPRFAGTIDSLDIAAAPINGNLRNVDAGDTVTFAIVVENKGSGWKGAFDTVIKDSLPAGFVMPGGGWNLSVTDGTGAALSFTDLGGGIFGNGIQLDDQSASDGGIDAYSQSSGKNIAIITFDAKLVDALAVPRALSNGAEVTNYAAKEGGINFGTDPEDENPLNDIATVSVQPSLTKVVASTSNTTGSGQGNGAIVDATIGELVTYTVTVRIPEGVLSGVTLQDILPRGADGVLKAVSGTLVSVGSNIVGPLSGMAATITDGDADGILDTLSWNLGGVTNTVDNVNDAKDLLTFSVTAVVLDNAKNAAGDLLTNTARLTSNDPLGGAPVVQTATAQIELVEPDVRIVKSVTPTTGDANDVFTYTIAITNQSGSFDATAYDLVVTDVLNTLPPALVFTPGSLAITSAPGYANATIVTGMAAGEPIEVHADSLKRGDSILLTFTAIAAPDAQTGVVITNVASVTSDTLPGVQAEEREKTVSDDATVRINSPSISKAVVATSFADTGSAQHSGGQPDVKVNEVVTYRITVTLAEGEARNLTVTDLLADVLATGNLGGALAYVAGSAHVVSVGSNITSVGGAVDLLNPAVTVTDTGANGNTDKVVLSFGTVMNTADGVSDAKDRIVIELQAKAVDVAANQNGDQLLNSVTVTTDTTTASASATVDFVQPLLDVQKTVSFATGDAGDVATYTITIRHAPGSTNAAYNIALGDVLQPGVEYVTGSATTSAGTLTDAGGTIGLTLASLPLAGPGSIVTITYRAKLVDGVVDGQVVNNVANITYDTDSDPALSRQLTDSDDATITVDIADALSKVILSTDNAYTTGSNLTAGETVTYRITATLGEGTQGIRLVDALPANLQYISSSLHSVSPSITAGAPAVTFDAGTNRLTYDFGTVVNAGNNTGTDTIVIEVVAKVVAGASGSVVNPASLIPSVPANPWGVAPGDGTPVNASASSPVVYAQVGNYAFEDFNGNGIQDGGDTGVAGVTVELRDFATGTVVATATTGANGLYLFTNVVPGKYYETFVKPAGWELTQAGQGTAATDSDPDPTTGQGAPFELFNSQSDLTHDVGLYRPASLGDLVWEDTDGDGVKDAGESGVAGVTVNLLDASNAVVGTTTTNGSGLYQFTGLKPGAYTVEFVKPAGWAFTPQFTGADATVDSNANVTTGKAPAVTLVSGSSNQTVDAGIYRPVTIGDLAFVDANGDGIQQGSEAGLAGVTVKLLDGTGAVVGTTTTDGSGAYAFTGLRPGAYQVEFLTPGGWKPTLANQGGDDATDSDASQATGKTPLKTYLSGDNDPTVDAGFWQPVSLGDRIWNDANGNGIQDGGETGVNGLTVTLLAADGVTVVKTTTTAGDGNYLFDDLSPGTYSVQFSKPAGWSYTQQGQGTAATDSDAVPATGLSAPVTLTTGQSNLTVDAGIWNPVTIGNHAWVDVNGDGIQNDGAGSALGGVQVQLVNTATGTVVATTTTAADGSYLFTVPPGTYKEIWVPPANYVPTITGQGTTATDSNVNPATGETAPITLSGGQSDLTQDGGFYIPVKIGDLVFEDQNGDGMQDAGDTPLAGVTVKLLDGAGNVVQTTTTAPDGSYLFSGVRPGTYQVEFVKPAGFTFTTKDAGGNDAKDSDADLVTGRTPLKTYVSGDVDRDVDAGLWRPVTIGDKAWLDVNGNGIQDGGAEIGLAGVTVKLYDATTGALLGTQVTDSNGNYLFTGLKPGSFREEWTAPTGYVFSQPDQGSDATDSDVLAANLGSGATATFAVTSGQADLTRDGGLYQLSTIKGTAFLDLPPGVCPPKWPQAVFAGITVQLLDTLGNVVTSAVTGSDGTYELGGIAPGTYTVRFLERDGLDLIAKGAGNPPLITSDVDAVTGRSDAITITTNMHVTGVDGGFTHVTGTVLDAAPIIVQPGFAQSGSTPANFFAPNGGSVTTSAPDTAVIGGAGGAAGSIFMAHAGGGYLVSGTGASSMTLALHAATGGVLYGSTGFMVGEGSEQNDIIIAGCGGSNNQAMGSAFDGTRDWNLMVGGTGEDLIEGNHGKGVLLGGAGNDRIFGFGEIVGGPNDGTVTVAGGVVTSLTIGDQLVLSGRGPSKVAYNPGDGVQVIYGFNPANGDTLDIYGFAQPAQFYTWQGMGVLYFGPNQAVVLHSWNPVNNGPTLPAGITFHPAEARMPGAFGDFQPLPPTILGASQDMFYGTQGDDIAVAHDGTDTTFFGGDGQDLLLGASGNDTFLMGKGGTTALGGEGRDFFVGSMGGAADRLEGGQGDDSYYVTNRFTTVTEKAGEGTDSALVAVNGWTVANHVETALLVGTATQMTGGATAQTLVANAALASDITAGSGKTTMIGGAVASVFHGNNLGGSFFGQGAADTYIGGSGDDTYGIANAGATIIEAPGGGHDVAIVTVNGWTAADNIEVVVLGGAANAVNLGSSGAIVVANPGMGSFASAIAGENYFFGGAGADNFSGGSGRDVFFGGTGATVMTGNGGDDTYVIYNAASQAIEAPGGGTDIAWAAVDGWTLGNAIEIGALTGNAVRLTGNATGSTLFANANLGSQLIAGSGNTTMVGSAFADTFTSGTGSDVMVLGGGADLVKLSGHWGVDGISDFSGHWGDGDKLDFRGSGLSFADLTIARFGDTVLVAHGGDAVGLWNVTQDLNASDFLFT